MTARTPVLAIGALAAATAPALARTFGAEAVAVSSGAHAQSGGPTISGDNRNARYVAFHPLPSSLVRGYTNGALDVFVLDRRRGGIARASVSSGGREANAASANPALDGSVQHAPHCVAFQSQATNLPPGDRDSSWDVYVRDLRTHTTPLVTRRVAASAVDPAIHRHYPQRALTH